MPKGALFISYSRPDIAAARNLFAELTRLGIPTWYDAGMKGGDEFDSKLDHNIENCSLFLPLISSGSLEREQGYFRKEWKKAVTRDEKFFGTNKGCIVPIIIDDDTGIMSAPQSYPGMPKRFLELHMYQCPNGKPSPDLIACFRESLNKRPPARSGTNE